MAELSEWTGYQALRGLISDALESAMWGEYAPDEVPYEITLAISPDLDKVDCILDPSGFEEMDFIRKHEGWHIESATDYESAVDKADLYFDLR